MKPASLAIAPIALLLAGLVAAPAFAEDISCNVPADKAQPADALKAKLQGEGWEVRKIETEHGCYEAYAVKADGSRLEAFYDPASFAFLGNDEG